jgi:hypothetical protein
MLRVLCGNPFPEEKKHVGIFKVLAKKVKRAEGVRKKKQRKE